MAKKWFTISLRSFLAAIALFLILLGLWVRSAERQRQAVYDLRQIGALVLYDFEADRFRRGAPHYLSRFTGVDFFHSVAEVSMDTAQPFRFHDPRRDYFTSEQREMANASLILRRYRGALLEPLERLSGLGALNLDIAHDPYVKSALSQTDERLQELGLLELRDELIESEEFSEVFAPDAPWEIAAGDQMALFIRPHDLSRLGKLQNLKELNVIIHSELEQGICPFVSSDFDFLDRLRNLESCTLGGIGGDLDPLLERLAKLPRLEFIEIRIQGGWMETDEPLAVTDSGIAHLGKLPKLKFLHLENASVTGVGFRDFSRDSPLESISLGVTKINKEGLGYLLNFPKLRSVDFGSLHITQEDYDRFHEILSSR